MSEGFKGKRVLMLSWEYPPKIVGGLARVVHALSHELAALGCEVHVVTSDHPETAQYELDGAVHVHRVKNQTDWTPDFMFWVHRLNFGLLQTALELQLAGSFDIIHAHDWLVSDAAWVMKTSFDLPLVCTIHATEQGRSQGLHNDTQRYINQIEWRLIFESREVIVNSAPMVRDLREQLNVPEGKVNVIPNGIYADRLLSTDSKLAVRSKHGLADGPVILFVGRLVYEKGVQVLLRSAPAVLHRFPNATFIIAGEGGYRPDLQHLAGMLNVHERVRFFGKANDADLRELYRIADVAVVPSLYEPFGIVVLEAMATRVPVVCSNSGGLNDIVTHMQNGIKTDAGDEGQLAAAIQMVLADFELADRLRRAALDHVTSNYSWRAIASRTLALYEKVS